MAKAQHRYKITQSVQQILNNQNTSHRRFGFFAARQKAMRVGRLIAPILAPFRFAIDFRDPRHCRIKNDQLILIVRDALQANRLKNLLPRITKRVLRANLGLTKVEVHIVPRRLETNVPTPHPNPLLGTTLQGALAAKRTAQRMKSPELKEIFRELAKVLTPKGSTTQTVLNEILREERRHLTHYTAIQKQLKALRQNDTLRFILPTPELVAKDPALGPVRRRLMKKIREKKAQQRNLTRYKTRLIHRLHLLMQARVSLNAKKETADSIIDRLFLPNTAKRLFRDFEILNQRYQIL